MALIDCQYLAMIIIIIVIEKMREDSKNNSISLRMAGYNYKAVIMFVKFVKDYRI